MKKYERESIYSSIGDYCAYFGARDFIEVTKWYDDEGLDIYISNKSGDVNLKLTYDEFNQLNKMIKEINKDE